MSAVALIAGLLIYLAKVPLILILMWLFVILIDYAWGGLAKIIRIIFLPGHILHRTTQNFVARLLGIEPRAYAVQSSGTTRVRSYLRLIDPRAATIIALSPAFTAMPFYLLSLALLNASRTLYAQLFAAWLALSIFLTGFPNLNDIEFIIMSIVVHKPLLQILLVWSVVIFIIALNIFDLAVSTIIALSYVFLIILANSYPRRRELTIIRDED